MISRYRSGTAFLVVLLFFMIGCHDRSRNQTPDSAIPRRILSLAPSITETLFELGVGDRVVGVTDFCSYPPQVKDLPGVGGYVDPRFEAILRLKPDIAFLLCEHEPLKKFLSAQGIAYVDIDNHNIEGILSSFERIGAACGRAEQGAALAEQIRHEFDSLDSAQSPPRVLLCVGRDNAGSGGIGTVFAAGPRSFYDQILVRAGGLNVIKDSLSTYPTLSAEGVVRLDPDIIIDFMPSMGQFTPETARKDWTGLKMVAAVRDSAVFCVSGDYSTIPGPRIVLLLRDLREIIRNHRERRVS